MHRVFSLGPHTARAYFLEHDMPHSGMSVRLSLLLVLLGSVISPADAGRSERRGLAARRQIAAGSAHTCVVVGICETGQRLEIDVVVEQGPVSNTGWAAGQCHDWLAEYRVSVPSSGKDGFMAGAGRAIATVVIRDKGEIVETQTWTRAVTAAAVTARQMIE